MNIVPHGEWESYAPNTLPPGAPHGALFVRRLGDGVDWYAHFRGIPVRPDRALGICLPSRGTLVIYAVQRDPRDLPVIPCTVIEVKGIDPADERPWKTLEGRVYDPKTNVILPREARDDGGNPR